MYELVNLNRLKEMKLKSNEVESINIDLIETLLIIREEIDSKLESLEIMSDSEEMKKFMQSKKEIKEGKSKPINELIQEDMSY